MPVFIVTKSDLVLRDIDLLRALRERKLCLVHISLISLNPNISALFEGTAPSPHKRLKVIEELSNEGIRVVVRMQPIIPYVNDEPSMLKKLIEAVSSSGGFSHCSGYPQDLGNRITKYIIFTGEN